MTATVLSLEDKFWSQVASKLYAIDIVRFSRVSDLFYKIAKEQSTYQVVANMYRSKYQIIRYKCKEDALWLFIHDDSQIVCKKNSENKELIHYATVEGLQKNIIQYGESPSEKYAYVINSKRYNLCQEISSKLDLYEDQDYRIEIKRGEKTVGSTVKLRNENVDFQNRKAFFFPQHYILAYCTWSTTPPCIKFYAIDYTKDFSKSYYIGKISGFFFQCATSSVDGKKLVGLELGINAMYNFGRTHQGSPPYNSLTVLNFN